MPNWYKNDLALRGDPARIAAFRQAHIKTETHDGEVDTCLDFESVTPMPEALSRRRDADCLTLKEIRAGVGRAAWEKHNAAAEAVIEWCCENWGTKWNPHLGVIEESPPDVLHLRFNTAWAPPIPAIRKLLEMWPDLKLEHYWGCDEGEYYSMQHDLKHYIETGEERATPAIMECEFGGEKFSGTWDECEAWCQAKRDAAEIPARSD
jgi:hypothetical protein